MTTEVDLSSILDDRQPRRIGYIILALVFGVFGGWACIAPLDSAALGQGLVTVKSYRKTVQHLEGGIVRELHVHDGDSVAAGDVLLTLDTTHLQAEREVLNNQQVSTAALEARLIAELQQAKKMATPKALLLEPRALEAWKTEQALLKARYRSREGETQILQQAIGQLDEQITGLQAVISNKQRLVQSHNEEASDLRALLKEGFTDKQRLREQERNLERLAAEIAEHNSSIAQARQRRGELRLQILQIEKTFTHEVTTQLVAAQTQAFDISERLRSIDERLQRSHIKAPASGMVLNMNIHTLGAVITAGQPIMEIVPENADLIIETRINPNDIDRVMVGKNADIRFSAFNSATMPVIEGILDQISADALVDSNSGQSYYLGRVSITEKGLKGLGKQTLLPGMPAEVLINTGSRTLLSYLLQPARNWMARSLNED
jgi:epimerase transport system membrane fusion protein